jgi:hypothetical protein
VLTPHLKGGLVLALGVESVTSTAAASLRELAQRLAPRGGSVRLYSLDDSTPVSIEGIELLSHREAVRPLIREALREHAGQCKSAWTPERERRFVTGRARLDTGEELPVPEALDRALTRGQRALLLGDFGSGKTCQLERRAHTMALEYLANERAAALVLLRLRGLPPELGALLERHLPGMQVETFRLAVDLGMAVPLMDGLDELRLEGQPYDKALQKLVTAFRGAQARMVVSSRKTVFRTAEQLREVESRASQISLVDLLAWMSVSRTSSSRSARCICSRSSTIPASRGCWAKAYGRLREARVIPTS